MAWTAPMTATANSAFTAAQFNTYVRDNLNETAPAKATAASQIFVATGTNSIAARTITGASVDTDQTTTSTSFTDLTTTGPAVTVTTGTYALVFVTAKVLNSASVSSFMGHAVSGATTIAAADSNAFVVDPGASNQVRATALAFRGGDLTAGSNTFTCKYRVDSGTGTFGNRRIVVIPL
jgi:hypothetical protein